MLNPDLTLLGAPSIRVRARLLEQQRWFGKGAPDAGEDGAESDVKERAHGRETAAHDAETGLYGCPDKEIVGYIWKSVRFRSQKEDFDRLTNMSSRMIQGRK